MSDFGVSTSIETLENIIEEYGSPGYVLIFRPGDHGKIRDYLELQLSYEPVIVRDLIHVYRVIFVEFHVSFTKVNCETMVLAWTGECFMEAPPSTISEIITQETMVSDRDVIDFCHQIGIRCDYGDIAQ